MSIVRIDSDSTHGWQARVKRGEGIKPLTMLCSDSVHGGRDQAERAARKALRLLELQAWLERRPAVLASLQGLLPITTRKKARA